MKQLFYLIVALFLSAGLFTSSSCNKIEEATTVEFTASYDAELQLVPESRNMDGSFSAYATIDPTSDSDFNKYLNKIKDIGVISITGKAIYVDPDFIIQSAELRIYSDNNAAKWGYLNVPVTDGTELTLGNEDGQWDTVAEIANEKKVYHVSLIGSANVDELSCTVLITIKYKVKAGAL